jgi:hypothetical protein
MAQQRAFLPSTGQLPGHHNPFHPRNIHVSAGAHGASEVKSFAPFQPVSVSRSYVNKTCLYD